MNFKTLINYIGKALVGLSFGFLFYLIYSLDFTAILKYFKFSWIIWIVSFSFLFSLLYFLIAYAYKILLELVTSKELSIEVIRVYLKTVIFKYAPGNIFHFLGRHSLVESCKIKHKDLVFANTSEIILQLVGVSILLILGVLIFDFSLDFGNYLEFSKRTLILSFGLLLAFILGILLSKKYRTIFLNKSSIIDILKVIQLQTIFIFASASTFALVLALFFDVNYTSDTFIHTIFIAIIAWFLGFVVPGAPGGIGIRESVLVLFIPAILSISKEIVFAGAIIYRLISILGESLTYFLAKFVKTKGIS